MLGSGVHTGRNNACRSSQTRLEFDGGKLKFKGKGSELSLYFDAAKALDKGNVYMTRRP